MPQAPQRISPIHHLLDAYQAQWSHIGDAPIALRLAAAETERRAMIDAVGLCDLSALSKLGVKGAGVQRWLHDRNVDVPDAIYASRQLADGGVIARVAGDEFVLESGINNETVPALTVQLQSGQAEVARVEWQETTFLLIGPRARDVLAQTCGINFRDVAARQLIFTRVAGVSCAVLPDPVGDIWACRFWIEPSYAVYLWETLVEICEGLEGSPIGAGCIFPELLP